MDKNLRSCSKCGHIISETAESCTYCGTVVSSGESPPQPEETQPKISEPAAQAGSGAQNPLSDVDDQIDYQLPDEELIVALDTEEMAKDPAQTSGADTVAAEIKEPELKPDTSFDLDDIVDLELHAAEAAAEAIPLAGRVSAKAASDNSPGLPETPVLEVSGEDPSESETLGADILELVEVEASAPESARNQASETATSSDEPDVEQKVEPAPDPLPDGSDNDEGELEALLLTSDDEVQLGTQSLPADVEEAVETGASEKPVELAALAAGAAAISDDSSESGEARAKAEVIRTQTEAQASVGALKIEKASQELVEAQKKQKADIAKALKMKKLKLAQVQALQRKKAAILKARALKKQKEAQAGIEKANKEMATGSNSQKVDTPKMIIQRMEANTKILGLLKKYEGQVIGINYDNSADIKEAELVEANDEFFSVFVKDQELKYSHPLKTILTIIEGKDGVGTGTPDQKTKFNAVIKVYPLVLF